jgi:nucleotide-binding universal stress UspA family protein
MYKDILFPIDITEESSWKEALPVVLEHIAAFNSRLHIMTVLSDGSMSLVQQYFPGGSIERLTEQTQTALHDFVKKHIPKDVEVQHVLAKGSVYECIIKTADEVKADLIVMSAHRPELRDYLLGPNAAKVVRHSKISVLVVRTK